MWSHVNKKIIMNNIKILKDKFTETYKKHKWHHGNGESKSGEGSSLYWTQNYRNELTKIIDEYSINKILDCSCGDWNWMKKLSNKLVDYTGIDIVEDLINRNIENYSNNSIKFLCKDMLSFLIETSDEYDLIICRHTFEHLPTEYGLETMKIIKQKTKYCLFSSQDINQNLDINFDGHSSRNLNLNFEPYISLLGKPIYKFVDSPIHNDVLTYDNVFANLYKFKT